MKSSIILLLLSVLLLSCTKDDNDNLTTSFQGIVLKGDTNEPISGGEIKVMGSKNLEFTYEKFFPIELDGTFNIRITTDNVSLFLLSMEGFYVSCSGPSTISQYCTLMSAGEDHTGIKVIVGGSN